jgi:hypothetical protein
MAVWKGSVDGGASALYHVPFRVIQFAVWLRMLVFRVFFTKSHRVSRFDQLIVN